MTLNPSPIELVTALTDFLICLLVLYIPWRYLRLAGFKASTWKWVCWLLGVASFLGVVAHGLDLTPQVSALVWMPLNLSLGLTLGLFVVGAMVDLAGEAAARKILPWMLVLGLVFFGVTVLIPDTFLTFIAYEALAMLFALGVYGYLTVRGMLPGAGWMTAAVLVTLLAAVVQATGHSGQAIFWYFDNNGVFHLIQMVGLGLLAVGLDVWIKRQA